MSSKNSTGARTGKCFILLIINHSEPKRKGSTLSKNYLQGFRAIGKTTAANSYYAIRKTQWAFEYTSQHPNEQLYNSLITSNLPTNGHISIVDMYHRPGYTSNFSTILEGRASKYQACSKASNSSSKALASSFLR